MQAAPLPLEPSSEIRAYSYVASPDGSLWAIDPRDPDFEDYVNQQQRQQKTTPFRGWFRRAVSAVAGI